MTAPSPRQLVVLRHVALGRSNREIARRLWMSEGTVKTHLRNLFKNLGAQDRAHAVSIALFAGYLELVPDADGFDVPVSAGREPAGLKRVCARPGCTAELVRRKTEGDVRWAARKYCSRPCAVRFGPRKESANPDGVCPDPTDLDECGDCGRAMHRSRRSTSCAVHAHHRALGLCRVCRRLSLLKPEPEPAALQLVNRMAS